MITAAAVVISVLLACLAVFQVLLVAGRPLGRLAWGGQYEVLPPALRVGSAVTVVSYAAIAWLVWRAVGGDVAPWMWILTAFFGLGVLMNAASRSRPERVVMTPVAVVLALSCLLIALA